MHCEIQDWHHEYSNEELLCDLPRPQAKAAGDQHMGQGGEEQVVGAVEEELTHSGCTGCKVCPLHGASRSVQDDGFLGSSGIQGLSSVTSGLCLPIVQGSY